MRKFLPKHINYILTIYVVGILLFTLFRVLILTVDFDRLDDITEGTTWLVLQAFFMGLRFDTTMSGYALILPLLLLSITYYFNLKSSLYYKAIQYYVFAWYVFFFSICAINVPYFAHFFSHFTVAGLIWTDSPLFMLKMVVQEVKYSWTIIPFVLVLFTFHKVLNTATGKLQLQYASFKNSELKWHRNITVIAILSVVCLGLMFLGIRGRISKKSPIRVGTAYFSNHPFINKLGLNPVYTFLNSYLHSIDEKNRGVNYLDSKVAVENVKNYFGTNNLSGGSPVARNIISETVITSKKNVVLIIMESMSAQKMGRYGNIKNLTPFLDSLVEKSYSFDNVYTSGIHTFNGVYSTTTSFPCLKTVHPMEQIPINKYNGIGTTLNSLGYKTIYFTTHDDQFDNVGGFMYANGFEKVISQKDYPSAEVKSTLGVPDDKMFKYSIPYLNELSASDAPFLAVLQTSSDHGPYILPDYFTPKSDDIMQQIVEYADWSIRGFMNNAAKQKWFNNTIFAFIADHGVPINATYDMPLAYHHSPFIIYSSDSTKTGSSENIGGQIDVFPTIMGHLELPYINNSMGIDLFSETRPFIYFGADNKYGVLNNEFYYVNRIEGGASLYKYKDKNRTDFSNKFPMLVDSMKTYAESMMQTTQWMIDNDKTDLHK